MGSCAGYPDPLQQVGQYYVYGFRVPLLVVSAYNVHGTGSFKGYISGALPAQGETPPHIHDFGSILNFVEYIFGSGGNSLPEIDAQNSYHYADFWAPDYWGNLQYCSRQVCPYALSDFFNFTQPPTPPIWITPINCPASCFLNFTGPPSLPDLEDGD